MKELAKIPFPPSEKNNYCIAKNIANLFNCEQVLNAINSNNYNYDIQADAVCLAHLRKSKNYTFALYVVPIIRNHPILGSSSWNDIKFILSNLQEEIRIDTEKNIHGVSYPLFLTVMTERKELHRITVIVQLDRFVLVDCRFKDFYQLDSLTELKKIYKGFHGLDAVAAGVADGPQKPETITMPLCFSSEVEFSHIFKEKIQEKLES